MPAHLTGRAVRVLVCTEKKTFVTRELPEVKVSFEGIEGDRHAGLTWPADVRTPWFPKGTPIRNTRQLSLVSSEELAQVAEALGIPKVLAAWLGASLEVAGVPQLTLLPPGTRLFFPEDAVLAVEGENEALHRPGAGHRGAPPGRPEAREPLREVRLAPPPGTGGLGGAARPAARRRRSAGDAAQARDVLAAPGRQGRWVGATRRLPLPLQGGSQSEHPAPPVYRSPCRVVALVWPCVAGDRDRPAGARAGRGRRP